MKFDPTANVEEQARLALRIERAIRRDQNPDPDDAESLAARVLELHSHIERGGQLPRQWIHTCPAHTSARTLCGAPATARIVATGPEGTRINHGPVCSDPEHQRRLWPSNSSPHDPRWTVALEPVTQEVPPS